MSRTRLHSPWMFSTIVLLACTGCGERTKTAAAQVRKSLADATEAVSELAPPSKSLFELQVDGQAVAIKGGQAQVVQISGRPLVLQITSYTDSQEETSPALFLRIAAKAAAIGELEGKTLPADLFYQRQKFESPLTTESGSQVQVTIRSATQSYVIVHFEPVTLIDAQGQATLKLGGTLTALVKSAPMGTMP